VIHVQEAPPPHYDPGSHKTWNAFEKIRQAIEESFPRGWIMPADQTPPTVSAEVEAIVSAIDTVGNALSVDWGIGLSGRLGHA